MESPTDAAGFPIVAKETLAPRVVRYVVGAPEVARAHRAGQFVIVRVCEDGERIPLSIADADPAAGTITMVVQEVGKTTALLATLPAGAALCDVVGPLGRPTHVARFGTVLCVAGGIGIAPMHPIARAMREAGNRVVSILGARSRELVILEEEMRRASDEVRICTDDGTYGRKGLVTDLLDAFVAERGKPALAVAIGPPIMMKFVCRRTAEHDVRTVVSLNPIMVDGTGMCGCCRVTVGGRTRFVCVDGPEFDGHQVDFDELMRRQRFYAEQEREAYDRFRGACAGGAAEG